MSELVTKALVLDELTRLFVAFPTHQGMKNNPTGTAEIYCELLSQVSGEALRAAVKIVIQEDTYFPKVSRLLQAALEWTRRNRAVVEPEITNLLWCPRCRTQAAWRSLWRPTVDGQGFVLVGADDAGVQFVALEVTQRLVCECASVSLYAPEPDMDGHWMRADRIKWLCGRPRVTTTGRPPRWIPPSSHPEGLTPIGTVIAEVPGTALVDVVEHAADD